MLFMCLNEPVKKMDQDMKYYVILIVIILCLLNLLSCHSDNKQSNTIPSPFTCDIRDILPQVDKLLAEYTFEAHYITVHEKLVLSIWLVVPELDPYASAETIAENSRLAFLWGAKISHNAISQIDCVRELFDGINPMIVDKNYNCWYRDIIPIEVLLIAQDPLDEALLSAIMRSGMRQSYLRTLPVWSGEHGQGTKQSEWPELRGVIQEILCKTQKRCNSAAYPLIFNEYFTIQMYWEAITENEMDDTVVYDHLEQLVEKLSDTTIPVDRLEVCIVNSQGRLLIYSKVNGYVIRSPDEEYTLKDQIKLYHMP